MNFVATQVSTWCKFFSYQMKSYFVVSSETLIMRFSFRNFVASYHPVSIPFSSGNFAARPIRIMPSITTKCPWLRENVLCLNQSPFSNLALYAIRSGRAFYANTLKEIILLRIWERQNLVVRHNLGYTKTMEGFVTHLEKTTDFVSVQNLHILNAI